MDAEEQKLLAEFARKAESHEQRMRDRPKLEFTVERERTTLEAKLEMKVESPDAPLLQQEVDKKVTQLRNESDQALASVKQNEEIDKLIAEVGQRRAEWNVVNAVVEEYEEAFDLADARLRGVPPPPKNPLRETLNGLGPFPGYCSHPMDKAWKAECPIAHERPKGDEITDTTKKLAANSQSEAAKLASLKAELERRRKLAAPKQQALQTAVGALTLARERHQKELEKLKAPAQEFAPFYQQSKLHVQGHGGLGEVCARYQSGAVVRHGALDVECTALAGGINSAIHKRPHVNGGGLFQCRAQRPAGAKRQLAFTFLC